MSLNRKILINRIKERMVHVENGVTCSGGETATTYLDIPGVLKDRLTLSTAAVVLFDHCIELDLFVHRVMYGGPTTGAIPLVLGVTMLEFMPAEAEWFIVRDKVKEHGLGRMFVGAEPGPGDKVILTDDVVSSGRSLIETVGVVQATGAQVVAVVPLVDRGDKAAKFFAEINILYLPVLTYSDLDLPPLGE